MSGLDELAMQARSGDNAALQKLLIESQPDIRKFAYRNCRRGEDAEDAIQHALIVIYTRIDSFRAASKFTSWIFAVIRNECSRLHKATLKLLTHKKDQEEMEDQFDNFSRVELIDMLVPAIASLPTPQRSVFVLREIEGQTTQRTACLLGISESNVKVRLHRARQRLRAELGVDGTY